MKETAVMIAVRDRPTEVSMLLQSLAYQTYTDFDIFIRDDAGGTPLTTYHFYNCIFNLLRMKGFRIYFNRNEFGLGVSKNRQKLVEDTKINKYKYLARVDDDVVLEPDFLERLIKVIEKGYDLASGVTPVMVSPTFIRDSNYVKIGNQVVLDNEGNYLFNGDDFGYKYTDDKIIPAHHFRSSALYKAEIHDKVNYTPTKLSKHGFREEQFFSFKCLMNGYKIGVDLGAIAWHQMTPSGGERFPDQNDLVQFNEKILREWTKEHKDELNKIFGRPKLTEQELMKDTNLARKF
ncbi:MAG: glycosyltransferase family 2 protein [Nanoarchaeota archaeon]|nr:glycosyltransferase family 2 protein [Nanoarchaeota archaeon]